MDPLDPKNKPSPLPRIMTLVLLFVLPLIGFMLGRNLERQTAVRYLDKADTAPVVTLAPSPPTTEPDIVFEDGSEMTPSKLTTFRGTLVKEKIPPELELGDEWFWLYFDEPFLNYYSAIGFPVYEHKMQITGSQQSKYNLDNFTGKHVEIAATLSWGYAESNILVMHAITEL
jgi:hypothetical protein